MGPAFRLLQAYLARQGLPPLTEEGVGRVTIHVDDRYRVQVAIIHQICVALRARLVPMPATSIERDALIMDAGRWMQMLLPDYAATCVVDVRDDSLWLQQTVVANATIETFELAMASFVNVLAFWSATHDQNAVIR